MTSHPLSQAATSALHDKVVPAVQGTASPAGWI
jgi:hypothetical protein